MDKKRIIKDLLNSYYILQEIGTVDIPSVDNNIKKAMYLIEMSLFNFGEEEKIKQYSSIKGGHFLWP